MSQHINCPNCSLSNPEGSKFCNHCGTKLPPPNKIACMNCGELNPRDLVYCDACGTRLETGKLPEPEPEQPEQPRTSLSNKIFSLPTREPGDTGELDPNTLPDWLRTGDTLAGQVQSPYAQENTNPSLTLDDLTNQGATGDLPDWLVDEGDTSSELFEPPRDITTEAYLEMIGQDPTDMISDEARAMAASAELPDWLTDVVGNDVDLTPTDPADTETPDSGLLLTNMPDWLAELNQSESPPPTEQIDEIDLSTPAESGWLNELNDEDQNDDGLSWLANEQDQGGDSFTELFSEAPSLPAETEEDDLAWLDADFAESPSPTTPEDTGFTSLFGNSEQNQSSDEVELSWLEDNEPTSTTSETGFTELFGDASTSAIEDDDLSWLEENKPTSTTSETGFTELFGDITDIGETPSSAENESETDSQNELESWFDFSDTPTDAPSAEEDVPDWLTDLGKPETDLFTSEEAFKAESAWQNEEPETDSEDISLDALFGETNVNEATADNTLADWLQELESPATNTETASTDEDVPDWLTDIEEAETFTPDDLLQTDDGTIGTAFSATNEPEEELAPDWLTALNDNTTDATDATESDIPDWLLDDTLQPTSTPTTMQEDEIPDWLSDVEAPSTTTDVNKANIADDDFGWMDDLDTESDDELPNWLDDAPSPEDDDSLPGFTGLLQDSTNQSDNASDSDSVSEMVQGDMPSWLGNLESDSGLASDVPDWLSDLGSEPALLDSEPALQNDLMDDLLSNNREYDATSALDWLSVADSIPEAETDIDWLNEEIEEATDTNQTAQEPVLLDDLEADSTSIGAFPDWLEAIDEGLFADIDLDDELVESTEILESEPEVLTNDLSATEEIAAEEPASEPEELFADDFAIDKDELPDWFSQLGEAEETPATADESLAMNEDVPLWLSDMRPAQEDTEGSSLSGLGSMDDLPGRLEEIPAELVGADLPDWLQADDLTIVPGTAQEMPDWLQAIEAERNEDLDSGLLDLGNQPVAPSDWLEDLPPSRDPREELARSDIPDWVAALKPQELSGDTDIQPPRGEKVAKGPLSGIRGAIEIQEVVTLPRAAVKPLTSYTLTSEQATQTELLRQLQRMEMTTAVNSETNPNIRATGRGVLALLLLVAIILGIFIGNGTNLINATETTPALIATYDQIEAVSGETVLVAFDYTPAMAGELNQSAHILLSQLESNNNEILTLSGYATGTSLGTELTPSNTASHLGYLPAEAIGLRQLAGCLTEGCETLYGREPEIALNDVDLIIVLTGEQDNLLNWIEQVQTATELPLVASVPQSIAPIANLYLQTGQLAGLVSGADAAYAYQQSYDITTDTNLSGTLTGQLFAQLIIVLVVLFAIGRAIIQHRREGA